MFRVELFGLALGRRRERRRPVIFEEHLRWDKWQRRQH